MIVNETGERYEGTSRERYEWVVVVKHEEREENT